MEQAAVLLGALDRFLETISRVKRRRDQAPLERRLEGAMARAFRAQGQAFLKRFRTLRPRFPRTDEPVEEAEVPPGPGPPGPGDWEPLFGEAAGATLRLFVGPIDVAAKEGLRRGALAVLADLKVGVRFDLKNPRAVAFLRERAAERVTGINDTTRKRLKTLITEATDQGWSYNRIAQAIKAEFDGFAVGKAQQHIDSRAHLVAVTEVGEAYTEGNMIAARDLRDSGLDMEKAWQTVGDDRVSEGCQHNQAAGWIPLDQEFPSGHQRPLRFPGCRCDLLIRRKKEVKAA